MPNRGLRAGAFQQARETARLERKEQARKRTVARIRSLREEASRLQAILDGRIK